ncbi:hypothetical protein [Streptomyces sp. NPDC007264]|uniref:hypothetical protein n=1 Tax=Streptomyces sp. NPDC007264 TaxID=3364777 RepID=UPI0036DE07A9
MERLHVFEPRSHRAPAPVPDRALPPGPVGRLLLPEELPATLGYDAVGTPRDQGERIMKCLPRVGCVFADDLRWWWIVPSGSQIGVTWPPSTSYAVDARVGRQAVPATGVRPADPSWSGPRPDHPVLIHRPDGDSPYTPPIPLYFLTCRLAGIAPHWSPGVGA